MALSNESHKHLGGHNSVSFERGKIMEDIIKVPAVSNLPAGGKGIELIEALKKIDEKNLDILLSMSFKNTCKLNLASGTKESLIQILKDCNLYPEIVSESEKALWENRARLFLIAFDAMKENIKENMPPKVVKQGKRGEDRKDWSKKETVEHFISVACPKEMLTFDKLGEKLGMGGAQVSSVFKDLREGKYASLGFPAKEYDPHKANRVKGRPRTT